MIERRHRTLAACVLWLAAGTGCAAQPPSQPLPGPRVPERVPSAPVVSTTAPALRGEGVPAELLDATRADVVARLRASAAAGKDGGAAAGTIELLVAESVVWADGSLGCGAPDRAYTMALEPGWRLVYGVGERRFHYHAGRAGHFSYCANPPRQPPGYPVPGTVAGHATR